MKNLTLLISFSIAVAALSGCGNKEATPDAQTPATSTSSKSRAGATLVAYDIGTKKKGDKGVCVVCNKNEGTTTEEEIVETLDYKGKTYIFCNEKEKAEFISDPKKFTGER